MLIAICLLIQDVGELVDELRRDDIETRTAAVRKLVEMGDAACAGLLPFLDDRDAEVRTRVREVILVIGPSAALIDVMLAGDDDLRRRAADVFHNLHSRFPGENWQELLSQCLEREPRRAITFEELSDDLLTMGVPVLAWPPGAAFPPSGKRHSGNYRAVLEAACGDAGWKHRLTEGGVLAFPADRAEEAARIPLCVAMVERLGADPSPSPISILFADLGTHELDRALIRRCAETEGFWGHARDVLIARAAKGLLCEKLDGAAVDAMAARITEGEWHRRAVAAQALAAYGRLPAGRLAHEDPLVRYLAAVICERAKIHDAALHPLLRDRVRDVRARALFASLAASKPEEMDFGAMLHSAATVAEADTEAAVETMRKLGASEALGLAVAQLLRSEHKDLAFRLVDIFRQDAVASAACESAEAEKEERYQERYLGLLQTYMQDSGLAKEAPRRALFTYFRLPSERVGDRAASLLEASPDAREGLISCLRHDLAVVRRRAVVSLARWSVREFGNGSAENDAVARVLEERAAGEMDREVADLARRCASALRVRGSKLPGDRIGGGSGGGGRYGGRIGGVKRAVGSPVQQPKIWRPFIDVTIPRPDLTVEK